MILFRTFELPQGIIQVFTPEGKGTFVDPIVAGPGLIRIQGMPGRLEIGANTVDTGTHGAFKITGEGGTHFNLTENGPRRWIGYNGATSQTIQATRHEDWPLNKPMLLSGRTFLSYPHLDSSAVWNVYFVRTERTDAAWDLHSRIINEGYNPLLDDLEPVEPVDPNPVDPEPPSYPDDPEVVTITHEAWDEIVYRVEEFVDESESLNNDALYLRDTLKSARV